MAGRSGRVAGILGCVVAAGLLLGLLLSRSDTSRLPASADYRTLVIFGDTQHLVENSGHAYKEFSDRVSWVIENRDAENIDFVLHVGDAIQKGHILERSRFDLIRREWQRFNRQWSRFDAAGIPYAIVRGNHDNRGGDNMRSGLPDGFFNYYGPSRFAALGYDFESCPSDETHDPCGPDLVGQKDVGHIWRFELGPGRPVRVAGLPNEPGPETVAWFRKRLLAEPDTPTIILSHQGLIPDPSEDAIWTALVADPNLPQIFMTTMGHYSHDKKKIEWVHGRQVLRIEFDYQNYSELDPPIPLWRAAIALVRFYFDAGSLQAVEAQTRIVPHRPGPRGRLLRTPFSISDDISATNR